MLNIKKIFIVAAASALALTMSAQDYGFIKDVQPYSVKMVLSEMARNPQASYLDGQQGNLKWNYTTGLELLSFFGVAERYDLDYPIDYVKDWADQMFDRNGNIKTYKKEDYTVDHVCPARIYFKLYDLYREKNYRNALKTINDQLIEHPRTESGEFWHKKIYPHQVWLDGLYMALPFYAEYAKRFYALSEKEDAYDDVVAQFEAAAKNTLDPKTGLFRHAWDESKSMFWADPETGQSQHAWGRANGWYALALVDALDYITSKDRRNALIGQLQYLLTAIKDYADPETGMWYQVLDAPGREGNYLESSASIMFTYATLKAYNRGYLTEDWKDYALALYRHFIKTFVKENPDGTISITNCCSVAGLGGKNNRAGDYDYYLSEPVIENDCKAVGPFIWASIEYETAYNIDYVFDGKCIRDGKAVTEELPAKELAFEGAEGCGKWTKGGKGGTVYTVTTLEDTGEEGSLRWAVEAKEPRIVEFAVQGEIHLTKPLTIRNPYISILGQTAPGAGITVMDYPMMISRTHDVIIRYMRFRLSDTAGVEDDALGSRRCNNVIIDHCTVSWATDENFSIYATSNATVQWCLISEALNSSVHEKGEHGYGGIWGGRNITFHHNLFAHNSSRNPRFDHPALYSGDDIILRRGAVEFVNNMVYNWHDKAIYGGEEGWFNIVDNIFRPGPATKHVDGQYLEFYISPITSMVPGEYYLQNNLYDITKIKKDDARRNEKKIEQNPEFYDGKSNLLPFTLREQYVSEGTDKLVKNLLKEVGASQKRDSIDKRVIKEVKKGTAAYTGSVTGYHGIIDSQNDLQK